MSAYALLWLPWVVGASALAGWLAVRARRLGDGYGALGWLGWALVPPALLLTGTVRLVGRVGTAVVNWATGFVFSPVTWLGLVVGGVAVALIGGAAALRRRRGPDEVLARGPTAADPKQVRRAPVDDEMAEIEAILKRRGIG